jgi:dephospho-CoA kinase
VAARLASLGFDVHSLSDVVRAEAARAGLPPDREHLIRIGTELRREGGPGVLAEKLVHRLGPRAVVDSIRTPGEVAVLRRLPHFVLVGVRARDELRFRRSLGRGRAGDARSLDEFRQRERDENTNDPAAQQLDATFRLADHVLENDGDLGALHAGVDDLLVRLGGGGREGRPRRG